MPAHAPAPALELGALHELVAAPGLRWMIYGYPRKISENAELRTAVEQLLPAERLDRFAADSGLDLRKLPAALVAGFDIGTLYLAETGGDPEHRAARLFIERLAGREVVERPHPRVLRVSGALQGTTHGFFDLDGKVVGLAEGDLTLSRIPVAYALGKLKKTPTALRGAALSTLPPPASEPLLSFYAPGPFDDEWRRAAHGVLGAALALAVHVEGVEAGRLRLTLFVSGDWSSSGQSALDTLEQAFDELATSQTGKLFALERGLPPRAGFHPQYLTLSVDVPLDPLIRGLRAAVIADVWEILDLPPPAPADGAARP